ncbi:MAG: hypothetical protein II821_00215 [Treponema sp.]|nr:hypothetical protein [Treponema sp.]
MKLSKKILAAFSVAAALAMAGTFVSCTEDDDDTEGAISGSGKNYTINYTNTKEELYRCQNTTTFKHMGELVKITFNDQTTNTHNGAMGFIWDLGQSKDAINNNSVTLGHTDKGYQNFMVVGFRNQSSGLQYYVSKFFNVTDLQADNFGASTKVTTHDAGIAKTDPVEIDVTGGWQSAGITSIATDKTMTVWVDIYPIFENSEYGVNKDAHSSDAAGTYYVDIYDSDPTATGFTGSPVKTTKIETSVTGYNAKPKQNTLAVYANVQPSKTLSGAWNLAKDYAADEVVEE